MVAGTSANGIPLAQRDNRYRMKVQFWLNVVKDDELQIMAFINKWKQSREFVTKLRRALMLYITLEEDKDLTLLDEWFPFVRAEKQELVARIERLEAAVMRTTAPPEHRTFALPGMEGLESLGQSIFASEPMDPSETRKNFASGMGDLFADDEDELWD